MNAPVSPTALSVRPKFAIAPDTGGSGGGAPFASALDEALSADRPRDGSSASDRGVERRNPEGRADRATERADDKTARKDVHASERAAHHESRRADRAEKSAERRAADRAAGDETPAADEAPSPAGETPDATGTTDVDPGGPAAEPATTGISGAVWALLMGGTSPAAGETATAQTAPVAAAAPADALADALAGGVADVALPVVAEAAAASGAAGDPGTPGAAVGAPLAQPSAVPAALAGLSVEIAPPLSVAPATSAPVTDAATTVVPGTVPPGTAVPPSPADVSAPVDAAAQPVPGADGTTTAVPPAGAGNPGGTASSGGDTSRQGAGSGETPAAPVTVTAAAAAPVAPTAATAVAAADAATAPATAAPVGSQVARQVAVLRGGPDGTQTMTLVLTPENLGPVEVSVTLTKGTVDLTLRGAHDMGRAALLDGLPDLRRDLESAGLTCSRLEVDRDTGGSWLARHSAQQGAHQGFGDRGGQHTPGENRSRPWGATADTADNGPTSTTNRSTSSGVDYRV